MAIACGDRVKVDGRCPELVQGCGRVVAETKLPRGKRVFTIKLEQLEYVWGVWQHKVVTINGEFVSKAG